jgi:hypothetical protein
MLGAEQRERLKNKLADETLVALSQKQIRKPLLLRKPPGQLQINVFRGNDWRNLICLSNDSEENYPSLKPMVRWLDDVCKERIRIFLTRRARTIACQALR